jgi:F-type H+-transporting ATPase subunit delta
MKLRSRAAHRYAAALHDLAKGAQALEAVSADVAKVRALLTESGELREFVRNYLIPSQFRSRAVQALFRDWVHPLTWRFLRFIESKRRFGLLAEMCAEFQDQEEIRKGIVRGRLDSAFALSPDTVDHMAVQVGRRMGKQVLLEMTENPDLLGGCRLQVGDTVYDYSLAARLRLVRQTMMAG